MTVIIEGYEDTKWLLEKLAPRVANNLNRASIHGLARYARDEIKRRAPRKDGTLKKAIKAKNKRMKYGVAESHVVVTRGKGTKNDGFYWRFIENGTVNRSAQPYVKPVKEKVKANFDRLYTNSFKEQLRKRVERANKRR